jgi:hypothetical protein
MNKVLSMKCPNELAKRVEAEARRREMTVSALLKRIVAESLGECSAAPISSVTPVARFGLVRVAPVAPVPSPMHQSYDHEQNCAF